MSEQIIFTLEYGSEWIPEEYYPVPAMKAVPQWYKTMETSMTNNKTEPNEVQKSQTIKRCMPVLDSIMAGYVIKLHVDLTVKYIDGILSFEWPDDSKQTVTFHDAFQVINYREKELPQGLPKLRNPWGIKTPKGYSCLFLPPLHRPDMGFRILEGLVDTDKYSNPVQFPFLLDKDFVGTIPAGTPVAQVIPFKRDAFRMEIGTDKDRKENDSVQKLLRSVWINGYRNHFRTHKEYL